MKRMMGRVLIIALAGVIIFGFAAQALYCQDQPQCPSKSESANAVGTSPSETGSQEQEAPALRHKRFPWLWVAAGVVAVGIASYLLFQPRPKYSLTVTMGNGIEGTPASGTYTYKKGESIRFNFTSRPGFKNVEVLLDGVACGVSGSIRMDRSHTLSASASLVPAPIEVYHTLNVTWSDGVMGTPGAGTFSYKEGESVHYGYLLVSGYTDLKVTLDGAEISAEGSFPMDRDHNLSASADRIVSDIDLSGEWTMERVSTMGGGTITIRAQFQNIPHHSGSVLWTGLVQLSSTSSTRWGVGQAHFLVQGGTLLIGNYGYSPFEYQGTLLNGTDHLQGTWIQSWGYPQGPWPAMDQGTWTATRNR